MLPAAELTRSVCQSCVSLSGLWVLATPLPELLVLLPIFLPYPLTLEVAKVDCLFSLVVLQTSCSSRARIPTAPQFSPKNLLCPVISACTRASLSLMSASVPLASSFRHLTCHHLHGNHSLAVSLNSDTVLRRATISPYSMRHLQPPSPYMFAVHFVHSDNYPTIMWYLEAGHRAFYLTGSLRLVFSFKT